MAAEPRAYIVFIGIVLGLVSMIAWRSWQFADMRQLRGTERDTVLIVPTVLVIIWLGVMALLASQGAFVDTSVLPPRIGVPAFILLATLVVVVIPLKATQNFLHDAPPYWFVQFQAFRILMEIVLWMLFKAGIIPVQMTFEGRNFDMLVGLTAPVISYICLTHRTMVSAETARRIVIGWNFVSMVILLNTVIVALRSVPSPLRVFMNEPANTVILSFPLVWLPTFVVPMALIAHGLSVRQMILQQQQNADKAG